MSEENMNMLDHLDELRKRIMIVVATFIVLLIAVFIYVQDIYEWFTKDLDMPLAVLGPLDIIVIYFTLAAVLAFALTLPVLVFQIWLFVRPGLTMKEQKASLIYIPASFILFLAGLAFGFYVVLPIVLSFLLELGSGTFETMFTADRYFNFVLRMTLPFSILFEMPLIVMFLTTIGLITPAGMKKNRKYAYFALIVLSVLISPPDLLSDILVIIPLLFLYEVSISMAKLVYKKKTKSDD
ncbi:twin-arginine translocase subunit TatC [Salipaludibacillus neizhouensis]|uniref:Sec-independent protein translocase protein TatC n=1 Tax=Salipaludibacillus neizhouensis TaxID=885475 RepID=A0A3A9K9S6_9BACI|nr:twin-arginine translocase subunit TatC [Salipaludibacillus neizhouensis]RKL67520.1 twin-arginine translocase subunit TatC [Salipaludibacillus neizhouensis]